MNQVALAKTAPVEHDGIADAETVLQVQNQLQLIVDAGASALVEADKIVIADQESADTAAETAKSLKKIEKQLEEARKAAVKPFNDVVDEINSLAKRFGGPFKTAALTLSNKVIAFQNAERLRLAAEQRRIHQEREAALLANQKPATPELRVLPKEPQKAISTRVSFSYEIIDFDLVPAKYKKTVIDDEKLGNEVRTQQVTAVPGVKIIRTETPIFR